MTSLAHDPSRDTPLADDDPGARLGARRVPLARSRMRMGPATHLVAERQRLAGLTWEHFDVRQLGPTVGGEVSGVDLTTTLAPPVVDELRRALHDYKVLVFRDQPLTSGQHVAFAARFGELEVHPFLPPNTGVPALVRFEKSERVGGYENNWHHDVTWREVPSMGAVLHAVQVPDVGGDTLFADMYAAFDELDDDLATRVEGLTAVHDFVASFGRQVPADRFDEVRATYPPVEHPVVCRHPATGRRHLYVNRVFVDRIVGLDPDEGAELLDLLCRQADYPEHQFRLRWEPHTVAFWDNRAVQHYACSDYWPEVRVMERASIVGTRPTS